MKIKVLGSGCANCKLLEANVREAVKQLGLSAEITKVEDFMEILNYGIMQTPAIVVDENVKSYGKVLSVSQIINILKEG